VPDDRLHQLPFESLVVEAPDPGAPPRYWLDAGPVLRYAASAAALVGLDRGPSRAPVPVFSVSAVAYDSSLEPLPGTARETVAIRSAFAADAVDVAQDAEAREPRVRAALPRARYLHLATHGFVDQAGGELLASLALTPPPAPSGHGDDGRLQLYELYETRLDAELAVLSACQSRVGRVVAGEGVFALSRGFLAAGARRVVASLWMADDDATSELVSRLFRGVAEAEGAGATPDFARALRDAKRAVRERPEWQHPFFWAPFVIEGAR
jgi:CHAT domain-containing protein